MHCNGRGEGMRREKRFCRLLPPPLLAGVTKNTVTVTAATGQPCQQIPESRRTHISDARVALHLSAFGLASFSLSLFPVLRNYPHRSDDHEARHVVVRRVVHVRCFHQLLDPPAAHWCTPACCGPFACFVALLGVQSGKPINCCFCAGLCALLPHHWLRLCLLCQPGIKGGETETHVTIHSPPVS